MKNIESKLIESRKYKPDIEFSRKSNLNPNLLKKLNSLYKNDPDVPMSTNMCFIQNNLGGGEQPCK